MQRTVDIGLVAWQAERLSQQQAHVRRFAAVVALCIGASACLAGLAPLQFSIVTLFLFAGPHNLFELRYFLTRMPVRFGRSRNFFLTAFLGIGVLTIAYLAMPLSSALGIITDQSWSNILATWNTLLLAWLGILVWLRGKQKSGRDWFWAIPVTLALSSLNWLAPEFFSLAIVYLHPLVALWFLDRHLRRTRPAWLSTYRRCLWLIPPLIVLMYWRLAQTPPLPDDNGLFWRITQHAGVTLLPNVSAHFLVSVHVFLEMLHYCVWLFALPLIAPLAKSVTDVSNTDETHPPKLRQYRFWSLKRIPLARHPRGFPKLVGAAFGMAIFAVVILWFGFATDYSTTRDIYFTVAIAHVLAEAPFLLKML